MGVAMGDVFDRPGLLPKRPAKGERRPSPQALKARHLYGPDVRWVKGPLPFALIGQACRLHRAALPVLLAIKREVDIQRWHRPKETEPEIAVTSALCDQLGLSSDARIRGVRALESAGLVTATWSDRRAPRVRLAVGLFDEGKITVNADHG
jgi:hypothetical protein